ncbi:hypothetical protein [Bradyrhizobium cenepequi]
MWKVLQRVRAGFNGSPDELRHEYTTGLAAHDLAAKMLDVCQLPQFADLVPHLDLLTKGAIHLTEMPPAYPDGYNKLIELYWASLCLGAGLNIELDHPIESDGRNPDVITSAELRRSKHGYALKTVRSSHTQNMLDHLKKGIEQIEVSSSTEGIVAFNLTPRLLQEHSIWPHDGCFLDWNMPAAAVVQGCARMVDQIVIDNGRPAIDALFRGKKATGSVLCLAFCPTVAFHPQTGKQVVMPLKVGTVVPVSHENPLSDAFGTELTVLNHMMQTTLGR